jgi:protein-S-isoprenylcysteine O-methyltransferase Ste14
VPERSGPLARPPGLFRHLLSILLLPFVGAVVVPALLVRSYDDEPGSAWLIVLGAALVACGLALMVWTISLFARIGRGTLAPWDPTRSLVAVGPYRHVRNPMITGVLLILLGEAAAFASIAVLVWAAVFFAVNTAWFVLVEEPGLRRRFGDEYDQYRRGVPRWLPRLSGARTRMSGDRTR